MTTLCTTCKHGLVTKYERTAVRVYHNGLGVRGTNLYNACTCLLCHTQRNAAVSIVECNSYEKAFKKVTYHDPDFSEYEKKVEGEN